jgi:hypothetical protein
MLGIESFLEKFKHIVPTDRIIKEQCIKTIHDICGITLEEKNIFVISSTITLTCRPAIKNEIILHKEEVLEILKQTLTEKTITNII